MSALIDRENALRVESPISVEKLRDTAKGIKTELGESIEDEDLDLSDFMDGFSAHQSSHNGSTGTGIGASAFKTISYLVRTGVEDSVPIIDLNINDNKLIVNGKAITKMSNDIGLFESLDALINAAIDNVKEQILPYFNLNGNTFSTFVGMMSCDGVGLDFAGRMAKQKVFQQVADSKGLTRNFGFNETSSIMSELVGAVSGKNTNFNDSPENELTTEYLKDALMLGKTLGVETLKDYHASIMSGERSITDDDIQFIRMQSHIFDHYKQFSKYGEALTKVSGYLSILRDMPTKQIDIEKKIELENDLFNENGSSKDDFPIKINDMFNSSPHIKAASETLHRLNEINSLFLFKHGAIARSFVDKIIELSSSIIEDTNTQSDEESSSESVSSLNSSIDSKVKMRDELITFLINCVN